jgi:hypothetical protein
VFVENAVDSVATSDNNAVNKGQLDAGLALKPNSTSVTNEINARITNEFTARITSDNELVCMAYLPVKV